MEDSEPTSGQPGAPEIITCRSYAAIPRNELYQIYLKPAVHIKVMSSNSKLQSPLGPARNT